MSIKRRIKLRSGTAAQWTAANPILLSAEEGFETDTGKRKIGDGTTAWNSLAYEAGGTSSGSFTDTITSNTTNAQLLDALNSWTNLDQNISNIYIDCILEDSDTTSARLHYNQFIKTTGKHTGVNTGVTTYTITGVTYDAVNKLNIYACNGHPFAVGDYVRISDISPLGLNGVKKVVAIETINDINISFSSDCPYTSYTAYISGGTASVINSWDHLLSGLATSTASGIANISGVIGELYGAYNYVNVVATTAIKKGASTYSKFYTGGSCTFTDIFYVNYNHLLNGNTSYIGAVLNYASLTYNLFEGNARYKGVELNGTYTDLNFSNSWCTVNTVYGHRIEITQTVGTITTTYGNYLTLSGTLGTKIGYYSYGEDYNLFSGRVRIGDIVTPTNALEVNGTILGKSLILQGATSGTLQLNATAVSGTNTITLPASTGTLITTGDTGTVTNTMLAGSIAYAKIQNISVTSRILGRITAGAGVIEELTAANVYSILSITASSSQLNYLSAATGTTGTTSTNLVFSTSPTLVTPNIGTPSAGTLTNCSGLPESGITDGTILARLAANETVGGTWTFTNQISGNISGKAATADAWFTGRTISLTGDVTGTSASWTGSANLSFAATIPPDTVTYAKIQNVSLTSRILGRITAGAGDIEELTAANVFSILSITASTTQLNYLSAATGTTGTTSTNLVFSTSPTLVTPNIGTPSAGTLTNCSGLPISGGVSGLGTGVATFLATPSSANLISAVTDETGSGKLVFATSPTFSTSLLTDSGTIGLFQTNATIINLGGATATTFILGKVRIGDSTVPTDRIETSGNIRCNAILVGANASYAYDADLYGYLQIKDNSPLAASISSACYNPTNTSSSGLSFFRSLNGSGLGHTIVTNDTRLGFIRFLASDGDEWVNGAWICAYVDGTPGNVDMPTRLAFLTTSDGSSSSVERVRIDSTGLLSCYYGLSVTGNSQFSSNISVTDITIGTGSNISEWSSSNTDIDGLISGVTTSGTLIKSKLNGHITLAIDSNDITDGFQIISKEAGNASYTKLCFEVKADGTTELFGGLLTLSNTTSNLISFPTYGAGAPTVSTRSAGTRISLWDSLDTYEIEFAIGIASGTLWNSVPSTSAFKWYIGSGASTLVNTLIYADNNNISISPPSNCTNSSAVFSVSGWGYAGSIGTRGAQSIYTLYPSNMTASRTHYPYIFDLINTEDGYGGYARVLTASWLSNVITFTTLTVHGFVAGRCINISGSTPSGYNGNYIIVSAPTTYTFTVAQTTNPGTYTSGAVIGLGITAMTWVSASSTTVTCAGHGLSNNNIIDISGVTPSGYNGVALTVSNVTTDTFTVVIAVNPGAYTSGGLIEKKHGYKPTANALMRVYNASADGLGGIMTSAVSCSPQIINRAGIAGRCTIENAYAVRPYIQNTAGGIITSAVGMYTGIQNDNGTMTNVYGLLNEMINPAGSTFGVVYGVNNSMYSSGSTSVTSTGFYGTYNNIRAVAAAVIPSIIGTSTSIYTTDQSSGITLAKGAYHELVAANSNNTSQYITTGFGVHNVFKCSPSYTQASTTFSLAYGVYNEFSQNTGTFTSAYGLYQLFSGTIGTKVGIYSSGETYSVLSGKLGLGAVTMPTNTLEVTGSALIGGAADNITISSTGVVTLTGAAKITHHEQLMVTTSSGAIFSTYATVVGGVQLNANTDYIYTTFEIFSAWDGTNQTLEIDWTPQTDITNAQTVILIINYKAIAENEDADTGSLKTITTTYTSSGTTSAGKLIHTAITLPYNDATQPLTANDHVYLRLNRDATADTFAGNVLITAFERNWVANKHSVVH